jgi:hypothetical protein
MTELKLLYQVFKEGRIKQISENIYELDGYTITYQNKQGRKLITCSCQNHARFCNSPVFCFHKEAIILAPIFQYYEDKLKEAALILKMNKGLVKNKLNEDQIIHFIEDIRRFNNG